MTQQLRAYQASMRAPTTSGRNHWPGRYQLLEEAASSYGLERQENSGAGDCLYLAMAQATLATHGPTTQQHWRNTIADVFVEMQQDTDTRDTMTASLGSLTKHKQGIRGKAWGEFLSLVIFCKPEFGDCTCVVWAPNYTLLLVAQWNEQPGTTVHHFLWTHTTLTSAPNHYVLLRETHTYDPHR